MKIIKTYQWNIAWYSLVELNDGSQVELKFRQAERPTNGVVLGQANDFQQAVAVARQAEIEAEQEKKEKAKTVVDKETGAKVNKMTVKAFSKLIVDRLKEQPEIGNVLLSDIIQVGE